MGNDFEVENMKIIEELESKINYTFNDKGRLILALTHSSFANEKKNRRESNERLEFLGDAVLNIITSDYIYKNCPALAEGQMTKLRASLVCEASLMKCANNIQLGRYLFLGKGEENTGGRTRASILSDALEALIGAVYVDGGMEEVSRFIYGVIGFPFDDFRRKELFTDYKTKFQELIQRKSDRRIHYNILSEHGPDHDKVFVTQLFVGDALFGEGKGKNKKEAEQNAAKAALSKIKEGRNIIETIP